MPVFLGEEKMFSVLAHQAEVLVHLTNLLLFLRQIWS